MPRMILAPAVARWLNAAPEASRGEVALVVNGATVKDALDALFETHPQVRGYIVDERGALRHHVVAYIDGVAVTDKEHLTTPVPDDGEIHVFQALSGG